MADADRFMSHHSVTAVILLGILLAGYLPWISTQAVCGFQPWLSSDVLINVSIVLKDGVNRSSLGALDAYGTVRTVLGRVLTMTTTVGSLEDIRGLGFVETAMTSQLLKMSLDVSVPEIGASDVWVGINDSQGRPLTGQGVVVGIVDTGIDPYHGDFYLDNGSSKILFIWDQMAGRNGPGPMGIGLEYNRSQIEARVAVVSDSEGHGTHVSAIATSTGNAEDGEYKGVAPGAWLIVVKAGGKSRIMPTMWSFNDSDIIEGVAYIMQKAASLGMRAVINLSLGSNIGGHDGTSPLELALEEAVKEGATIIVSAGNSGADNIHVQGRFTPGKTVALRWYVPGQVVAFDVDLWHSTQDVTGVTLVMPGGTTVHGPTTDQGEMTPGGSVLIVEEQSEKGKGHLVEVVRENGYLATGLYTLLIDPISVSSTGGWDSWLDDLPAGLLSSEFVPDPSYTITSAKTIGIPATSAYVIAVGAYSTRDSPGFPFGEMCSFSSRGPTRDGRVKPDLAAPGYSIVAAKSSVAVGLTPYSVDETHAVLSGTSMASPHVAGVVALLLQQNSSLSPQSVEEMLRESARLDVKTGSIDKAVGDFAWGWGKLDARLATGMMGVTVNVEGVPYYVDVQVTVDGLNKTMISGPRSANVYLSGKTSHQISVPTIIEEGWTRYVTRVSEISVSSSANITFPFNTEYYVVIDSKYGNLSSSGWYLKGAALSLGSGPTELQLGVGAKTVFKGWNITVPSTVDSPLAISAVWVEQFLLQVVDDQGRLISESWCDNGSKVGVVAPQSIPADGILGLIGVRRVMLDWENDRGDKIDPNNVIVDSPTTVVSVYRYDYTTSIEYAVILLVAAATIFLAARSTIGKKRQDWLESIPPPPP
jgi:subtilisin family serine protease